MNNKQKLHLLTVFIVLSATVYAAVNAADRTLKVYLPREITIREDIPKIDQIAILRGHEGLVEKAGDIIVGRFSTPDQNIIVNRNVILSRLACNGIPVSCVTMTGAEETVVRREHEMVAGNRFVETATAFLKKNLTDDSICNLDVIRAPEDLLLPGTNQNITFQCRLINSGIKNQSKVQVTAFQDGREIGAEEVVFAFRYTCHRVVAKSAIARGEVISTNNVQVEKAVSRFPEPAGWAAPYGLVAKRPIAAGTVLIDSMIGSPEPEVLVKRNQSVTIKIESAGLVATAIGKVLQDGVAGEFIKVQNVDSNIIVIAKVNEDGTVEPVY